MVGENIKLQHSIFQKNSKQKQYSYDKKGFKLLGSILQAVPIFDKKLKIFILNSLQF